MADRRSTKTAAYFLCEKMTYELPKYTEDEVITSFETKADYWEKFARTAEPEIAAHCRDYVAHLRTLAGCLRMDMVGVKSDCGGEGSHGSPES